MIRVPDGVDATFFAIKAPAEVAYEARLHSALDFPRLAYHGDIVGACRGLHKLALARAGTDGEASRRQRDDVFDNHQAH